MPITNRRFDSVSHQILDGDKVVALALAMASGGWVLTDLDGRTIDRTRRTTPKECAKRYAELFHAQ